MFFHAETGGGEKQKPRAGAVSLIACYRPPGELGDNCQEVQIFTHRSHKHERYLQQKDT